jgi:hypothetical protein
MSNTLKIFEICSQNIVLGNNVLLMQIVENLSSKEIYKLFLLSKSFTIYLNISYDDLICKIYKKLYLPLQIKNQLNFDILIMMTMRVLKLDHTLKYVNRQNTQFSGEEISIRNIIFDIVKFGNITSLYYLLFDGEFYDLLNRFIIDDIVVSPYECTHSNIIRKTLHYYGNEQTLRMALRFKKHHMICKILSDMKYITKKKNLDILWFLWGNNNMLYESITNCDYTGLNIMVNFINTENKQSIILSKSDADMSLSNNNYYGAELHRLEDYDDDDDISYHESNLLIYVLTKNINNLFINWDWHKYLPENLNSSDFCISYSKISESGEIIDVKYGDIIISDRLMEYMDNQKKDMFTRANTHRLYSSAQFELLANSLNDCNIDSYSHINNSYYLIPTLIMYNRDNFNLFIVIRLLIHRLKNFNVDFVYDAPHAWYHLNVQHEFIRDLPPIVNHTILEYITRLIHKVYKSHNNIFIDYDAFKYLINLLLIRDTVLKLQKNIIRL